MENSNSLGRCSVLHNFLDEEEDDGAPAVKCLTKLIKSSRVLVHAVDGRFPGVDDY